MELHEPTEDERSFSMQSMMFGALGVSHFTCEKKKVRPYAEEQIQIAQQILYRDIVVRTEFCILGLACCGKNPRSLKFVDDQQSSLSFVGVFFNKQNVI